MRWNQRLQIKDLIHHLGKEVQISGWVQFARKSGKIRFLGFRDGTGLIQCVLVKGETEQESFDRFKDYTQEVSVKIVGRVQQSKQGQFKVEILVSSIQLLSTSEDFPITPKDHGIDFLLSNRHLWLRSKKQVCILTIRDIVVQSLREFFSRNRFTLMDSPILTKVIGEDTSGLFSTQYFDLGNAYLAQTGQMYLEASIFSHGRTYCFGPTFRAEKSKTRRHLTEFWMLEGEMAFFDQNDNMDFQEDMIHFVLQKVLDKCEWQLEQLERDPEPLKKALKPFRRFSYTHAIALLKEKGSIIQWGQDLGATDESMLTEDSEVPAFVYDYPKEVKAFYMKENHEDTRTVKCSDLIATQGFGELIGGSQREDDYDLILQRIKDKNLSLEHYQWYLDLRRYGSVVHSGFGLGLERFVCWITGIKHVRETIPFPRLMERITP